MRYFYKIIDGVAILPVMHAVTLNRQLWVDDKIALRQAADLLAEDTPAMNHVPFAKKIAVDLMQMVGGSQLGRITIARLEPGKKMPVTKANGKYGAWFTSYSVVVQGLPGGIFTCGDEAVNMPTGSLWWFDAAAEHAAANNSGDDMIHMFIDIRVDG